MRIFSLSIFVFLGSIFFSTDLYSIHFTTIDDEDRSMQEFNGKKIMIVILPVTQTTDDSLFLRSVVRASENYGDKISIIGVPSFEDGFNTEDSNNVAFYYRSVMGRVITLGKGMYTKKTSGENQHPLFSWLTHADQNDHFDEDASGVKEKFFINEKGELYGIVSADGELDNDLMDRMVNN
jgi:glutathione peroxidase-family protein